LRPLSLGHCGRRAGGEAPAASNFGRPRNPAWYYNLRANPNATIARNGISREVVARELSGSERELSYQRGEEIFPGFIQYRRWASHRQIPVIRLQPLSRAFADQARLSHAGCGHR
jgi:deazaflavin-dependent oxidoreductase (nitroreductase family)